MLALTSLAPNRIERQAACIESWRRAGLEVVSFNHPSEIASLRAQFDVSFEPVEATAAPHYFGKRLIPISAMLLWGATRSAPAALVINSDIELRLNPAELRKLVGLVEAGSLVYFRRHEVLHDGKTTVYQSAGMDAFLVSNVDGGIFADSWLCMGAPYWDFWLPLAFLSSGRVTYSVESPVALHQVHEQQWGGREARLGLHELLRLLAARFQPFVDLIPSDFNVVETLIEDIFFLRTPIDQCGSPYTARLSSPIYIDGDVVGVYETDVQFSRTRASLVERLMAQQRRSVNDPRG